MVGATFGKRFSSLLLPLILHQVLVYLHHSPAVSMEEEEEPAIHVGKHVSRSRHVPEVRVWIPVNKKDNSSINEFFLII